MDSINTIFSSPLPVAISAVIAVACLAGYWFFVIPLLDEVKTLRETNSSTQQKMGDEFELQKANVQRFMQELAASLQSQQNITELVSTVSSLKLAVEHQTTALSGSLERMFEDVQEALERLTSALNQTSETSTRKHDEIRREVERLGRLLEQLTRQVADISDKQSQVAGVLTGMSIAKNMNRGL